VSAPYEEPLAPELTIDTRLIAADAGAEMIIDFLRRQAPPQRVIRDRRNLFVETRRGV
jgi:adenylylsulfate kinase-like enzyme